MSWVNEKGTEKIFFKVNVKPWAEESEQNKYEEVLHGIPIGTAIINHTLVLFTVVSDTSASDAGSYIYKLSLNPKGIVAGVTSGYALFGMLLYHGNLEFSSLHPIETLVSYESEGVQKVYWTDGMKQPRMINIVKPVGEHTYTDTSFDFVQDLKLEEEVTV